VVFKDFPYRFEPCFRQSVDKSLQIVARGH
jgi:hypothetical protein